MSKIVEYKTGVMQYPKYMEKRMDNVLDVLGKPGEVDCPKQFTPRLEKVLETVWEFEDAYWFNIWDTYINEMESIIETVNNSDDAWEKIILMMEKVLKEEKNSRK